MELLKKLEEAQAALADAAEKDKAKDATIAALTAERDSLKASGAGAVKALEDSKAEFAIALNAAGAALEAEKAEHAKTKTALEVAQKALANPAFAAAAVQGSKESVPEGGAGKEPEMSYEQADKAYNSLPNGIDGARAREEFRKKNWKALGLPEPK